MKHLEHRPSPTTPISRRDCLALIAAGAAGIGLLATPAHARRRVPLTYFGWSPIDRGPTYAKNVPGGTWSHLNIITGDGTTSLLVAFDSAFVLVDTKSAPVGAMLRDHFRYLRGNAAPPGLVINTHYHRDTTGGNEAFKGLVDIVAHPQAIRRISTQHMSYQIDAERFFKEAESTDRIKRGFIDLSLAKTKEAYKAWTPESFLPTKPMEGEKHAPGEKQALTVGSGKAQIAVELIHLGPAHTDGDIVVRFPKFNVMHVGDLCFNKAHAFIDRGTAGNTTAWLAALSKLIDLCDADTIIVPGNGLTTDRNGLKAQIKYFDTVRKAVKTLVDDGKQRRAAEDLVIDDFKDFALPHNRSACYGAVYDEFTRDGAKL